MRNTLLIIFFIVIVSACQRKAFKQRWTREQAPATYTTRFETTKGNFDIKVQREWSPAAADRFYQLVKHRYFNDVLFYRVIPGFVAQFGTSDTMLAKKWGGIPDEPMIHKNYKGTLSFARSAPRTRGAHLFINLADNFRLDTIAPAGVKGYPPFGEVIQGMDIVLSLYNGYGSKSMESWGLMTTDRQRYLDSFPKLDRIRKASILK